MHKEINELYDRLAEINHKLRPYFKSNYIYSKTVKELIEAKGEMLEADAEYDEKKEHD